VSEFRIGSIDGGQNIIGDHATMNNYGPADLAQARSLVDTLLQLVAQSSGQLADPETAKRAAEEARAEITMERPRGQVLRILMERIVSAAGSAVTVIQAAEDIRRVISQLT
jgi:hypothetical protein